MYRLFVFALSIGALAFLFSTDVLAVAQETDLARASMGSESILTLQLVDKDGKPWANAKVWTELHFHEGFMFPSCNQREQRTDSKGQIQVNLWRVFYSSVHRDLRIFMCDEEGVIQRAGLLKLNRDFAPGGHDLGNLELHERQVLLQGILRDLDKQPVANAKVVLRFDEWRVLTDRDRSFTMMPTQFSTRSNADGEFAIYGIPEQPSAEAQFIKHGYFPLRQTVEPGTQGLDISMLPPFTGRGRIILPEGVEPEEFSVELILNDEPPTDLWFDRESSVKSDGSFALTLLIPGKYMMIVRSTALGEVVMRRDPIDVNANPETWELGEIDLRSAVSMARLFVRDRSGRPVKGFQVRNRNERGSQYVSGHVAEIYTTEAGADLEIIADGKRAVLLENVNEDQNVVLREGYPIEINFAHPPQLPEGWTISCSFQFSYVDELTGKTDYWYQSVSTVGTETISMRLPFCGKYKLSLYLVSSEIMPSLCGVHHSEEIGESHRRKLEVLEQVQPQVFKFEIAEELKRASSELLRR